MDEQPGVSHPPTSPKKQPNTIRVAPLLIEVSQKNTDEVFTLVNNSPSGLTKSEAEERLAQYGPNEIAQAKRHGWLRRLGTAARNPLVILLTILAIISFSTGDVPSGVVMMVMVALGVSLRFFQGVRADHAAEQLQALVSNTATVVRGGKEEEVSLKRLVPGDIVLLATGDLMPADCRLIEARDLYVDQALLTGAPCAESVREARRTPVNIPKYMMMRTSSNFGNVFSTAGGARRGYGPCLS